MSLARHLQTLFILLLLILSCAGCEKREPFEVEEASTRAKIEERAQEVVAERERQHEEVERLIDQAQEQVEQALEQNEELRHFLSTD